MKLISFLIKNTLILLIKTIRPILGIYDTCRYPISCGIFAIDQLKNEPLTKSLPCIITRVLSCNPFSNIKFYFSKKICALIACSSDTADNSDKKC